MKTHNTTERLQTVLSLCAEFFRAEGRALPWRRDRDPYHVFLSEIMLQQTRIEAVIPYYERFLSVFPDVRALADADETLLLKCWQGLGYYSRARNLKRAAIRICEDFGGVFPADPASLLSLPGVGEYTAGAIGSIAFGLPTPAVDGNVLRIYARLLADGRNVLTPAFKRDAQATLSACYPTDGTAGDVTQGLMEIGQRFCLPGGVPRCEGCPLHPYCTVGQSGEYDRYPYREKKKPRKILPRTVLLCYREDAFYIRRRPTDGLLGGLWEFPSTDGYLSLEEAIAFADALGLAPTGGVETVSAKHVFTHLEWHMKGYLIVCSGKAPDGFVLASREALRDTYPTASALRAFLAVALENQ